MTSFKGILEGTKLYVDITKYKGDFSPEFYKVKYIIFNKSDVRDNFIWSNGYDSSGKIIVGNAGWYLHELHEQELILFI